MTSSFEPIAATTVDFIYADGRRVPGRIWLGCPNQVDEVEARCPCGIDGLDNHLPAVGGSDTLQAMLLAARLVASRLSDFKEKGGRIVHRGTDEPFELDPYFGKWVAEGAVFHRQGERIHIQLDRDEALVLFEWLAQHDGSLPIDDRAEQDVLWRVEAGLESVLVEPLRPDYGKLVEAARNRLRGRE